MTDLKQLIVPAAIGPFCFVFVCGIIVILRTLPDD
jgi:hypothetical protein